MEVKILIPTGSDIGKIKAEYPDIYQDDADSDGYDVYFIGGSSDEDGNERDSPEEWLTWDESIQCCGFIDGVMPAAETQMEDSGEWAMSEARGTAIWNNAFEAGKALR